MPRGLLEACHEGSGAECEECFQDVPSRLAGGLSASQRASRRGTSLAEDVYKSVTVRGRGLRSSYGEFLQGPDVPSDFMPKASPDVESELKLPSQPGDDDGSVVVIEQVDPSENAADGGHAMPIPPAAAQALAAQLTAAGLKDAMQTTQDSVDDIQPHVAPSPEEVDIGEDSSRALPGGPELGRSEGDVEYWVMEDGGDGKGPVVVEHEHHTVHHTHHGHEHVGHVPRSAVSNHHMAVQQHLTANSVHKHAEPSVKSPHQPSKSQEPPPKTSQELDREAEQLLQEPRVADWQPKIVLGGALAIFAQVYLWGTVFVTLFKRPNGAPQTADVAQASAASAGPPAPTPSAPIVLSGAGGLLRGQAAAAASPTTVSTASPAMPNPSPTGPAS